MMSRSLVLFFLISLSSLTTTAVTAAYFDISSCTSLSCVHVSPSGSDGSSGTISSPLRTIIQALNLSITRRNNNGVDAVTIVLDDGVYSGGITWRGSGISLTSRSGASATTINCGGLTFGLNLPDQSISTSISGITIRGCKGTAGGGGVVVMGEESTPILRDMIITENVAQVGGGLFINLAYPTLINIVFVNNTARQGGAIAILGNTNTVIIRDCLITNNNAAGSVAGGVHLNIARVDMINTTFTNNYAVMSGAIHVDSSILVLRGCNLISNTATADDSGGIYSIRGVVEAYDTVFKLNKSGGKGAAIKVFLPYHVSRDLTRFPYDFRAIRTVFDQNQGAEDGCINLKDYATAYLEDVIVTGNRGNGGQIFWGPNVVGTMYRVYIANGLSDLGGGMTLKGGIVSCTNCTFTKNAATTVGGAINVNSKGLLTLINPIITYNTAAAGGGGIACVGTSTCTITGGTMVGNVATTGEGGGIGMVASKLTTMSVTFINNTASRGSAINIGLGATSTITSSMFQANRGDSGQIFFVTPTTATSATQLATNSYSDGVAAYGNEFATAPASLSFMTDDTIMTSTQRSDGVMIPITTMIRTIDNVASFPLRIVLLDAYGQRVDSAQAKDSDVFAAVTPFISNNNNNNNNTNSTSNNNITSTSGSVSPPPMITNLDRIRMPSGVASFALGVAGELGRTYIITFTSSITGVTPVTLMVNIQTCGELDYLTYYPPGYETYHVCNPATPEYISDSVFWGIIILCIISILVVVAVQFATLAYWKTPIFRSSTPSFMSLLLLGSVIGYIGIILANIDVNRTSSGMSLFNQLCHTQYWLLGICFVLMFGTLALKNWRIRRIFVNKSLVGIAANVRTKYLFARLGVLLLIEMIINIVWISSDSLHGKLSLNDKRYVATCQAQTSNVFLGIMLASKGCIAVACVLLAYQTRDVTSRFNESRQLMAASYNMFVSVIVVTALSLSLPNYHQQHISFSVGAWFVITSTWCILYLPKLFLATFQANLNISSQGTRGGSGKHHSGSDHNSSEHTILKNNNGAATTTVSGSATPAMHQMRHGSVGSRKSSGRTTPQKSSIPNSPINTGTRRVSLAIPSTLHTASGFSNSPSMGTVTLHSNLPFHPPPPPPFPRSPLSHGTGSVSSPGSGSSSPALTGVVGSGTLTPGSRFTLHLLQDSPQYGSDQTLPELMLSPSAQSQAQSQSQSHAQSHTQEATTRRITKSAQNYV